MTGRHLFTSSAGVRHIWVDEGDTKRVVSTQDTTDILDHNRAQAGHNSGWSQSRVMRRAASIPAIVRLKWLVEEGWDCLSQDPGCQRKLFEKLDSSDFAHLRTAEFRLGVLRGSGAF